MSRPLDPAVVRPDGTAVVTMELQRGIVGPESLVPDLGEQLRAAGGVGNVRRLLTAARPAGVAVASMRFPPTQHLALGGAVMSQTAQAFSHSSHWVWAAQSVFG